MQTCIARSYHHNLTAQAMHCKWLVLCIQTSAHMAGNQWYCVVWHYMQIPAMVDVMASCSSAPSVVTWAGQLMYGSTFQWGHFHTDCMVWWLTAHSHTWHINVSQFPYQNSGLYHCVYMRKYHKLNTISSLVFSQQSLLVGCYECLAKFCKGICKNQDVFFTVFQRIHFGKINTH